MLSLILYFIVSVSGASVLALEILGTRILGPFYGVSLFLWSALISVTLGALALGYTIGGRWADRGPSLMRLASVLALAGVWTALIPWIRTPVLLLVEPLGLRGAVLLASFILFAPPLVLLGMVTPYAVRLRVTRVGEVGRAAGNIYAVSTLASVAAALLTGFVLVPGVGVRRLTILVGVFLLLGAAVAALAARDSRRRVLPALVFFLAGAGALWQMPRVVPQAHGNLLAVTQSPYGEIRVLDKNGLRYLVIDGSLHTQIDPATGESHFRYVVAMDLAKLMFSQPGKALVVGLGGGSVVKGLARSLWKVDAVEIDLEVVRLAGEYFGLEADDAEVFTMDGRRFLNRERGPYDLIVLDAFGSGSVPFHLVTREFFGLVKRSLAPGGIVALNLETRGWDDILVRSVAATLAPDFREVLALPTQEPPNTLGNVILLASDRELDLPEAALPHPQDFLYDPYQHWWVVQLNHAWDNRFRPEPTGAPVLTDDRNPVDLWGEEINLAARRGLHEFFDPEDLSW